MHTAEIQNILIDGWRAPVVPVGFDALVACQYADHVELDFINEAKRSFASEEREVHIPWPWKSGHAPTATDWKRIGVDVIDFR